ncbi:hypothetical protein V2J09_013553 [Rumex salicifolius]
MFKAQYLLKHNKVDILFLLEPQISGVTTQKVLNRLNFSYWRRWMRWVGVEEFESCVKNIDDPLFTGEISIRTGGTLILSDDSSIFADFILNQNLVDMGFCGSSFTWKRGISVASRVSKRLNRVLTNLSGHLNWEEAIIKHLCLFLLIIIPFCCVWKASRAALNPGALFASRPPGSTTPSFLALLGSTGFPPLIVVRLWLF